MQQQEALALAQSLTYKAEWFFEAYTYGRHIELTAYYQVSDSDVSYAPDYSRKATVFTSWRLSYEDKTREEFIWSLFQVIQEIEMHEAREFFSVTGSDGKRYHKPYHPHTTPGQWLWAKHNNFDVNSSCRADRAYNQDGLIHEREARKERV